MKGLLLNDKDDDLDLTKDDIPKDPNSKEYIDFRDRAAYVYITGTFPTHVRKYFTTLLRMATESAMGKSSLDGRSGHLKVAPDVVAILRLDEHPMVRKSKTYVSDGYVLATPTSVKDRRPFGKVDLVHPKTGDKVTIKSDGSVL